MTDSDGSAAIRAGSPVTKLDRGEPDDRPLSRAARAFEALAAGKPQAEREAIARDVLSTLLESERRRAVRGG